MPTLPPEQAPPPPELHRARRLAESFGADPAGYDRARPAYPDELVARIVGDRAAPDVLDIGCGTGIAGRQFQAAGATVLGVEPDERMAAFARSRGLPVEVATFEDWEPNGRSFDLLIAAQSWHWVDPATGPRKAAGLLRPGGRLALFGHVFEPPTEIAGAFAEAYRRVVPDSPFGQGSGRRPLQVYQAGYARIAETLGESAGWQDIEQWRFDWQRHYTRDEWLALLPTTGGIAPLRPDQQAEVLAAVGTAIDAAGGGFTMEYVTLAVTAVRTA
ncbi:methyltransferase type 11 [Actinocatenispora thailandica]|uniref:Methyltransferase type 11 n=1 Tax=Actinocatenispora thailandica TaxID=227318 RepID=A0A7R7DW94_9ACTN|nr:class I SAM-dependent methyltransferase [Actinocatenispora thailandica]BCJ38537.1 methyltransferase type 11 [Actinocatenispora thailandica]